MLNRYQSPKSDPSSSVCASSLALVGLSSALSGTELALTARSGRAEEEVEMARSHPPSRGDMARRPPLATQPPIRAAGGFPAEKVERIRHLGLGFKLRDRRTGVDGEKENAVLCIFEQNCSCIVAPTLPFASFQKAGRRIIYPEVFSTLEVHVERDVDR